MSFFLQPKPKQNTKKSLGITLAISAFVFLIYLIAPTFLGTVTRLTVSPLARSKNYVAQAVSQSKIWSSKTSLVDENIRLRKQNENLEEKLMLFSSISSQNDELRSNLNLRAKYTGAAAVITHAPSQSPFDFYVLDVPLNTRAKVGDTVAQGFIGLGTVSEINGTNAKAELFSNPGRITGARLIRSGVPLSLTGKGGGNFVTAAPRDLDIVVGDLLSLSTNPDLVLAKVASIEEGDTDSFKRVRLSFPKNIFALRFVQILYAQ